MHKVAVFDINGTLYKKSSKEEFFKYICFKKGYKLLNIFQIFIFKLIEKLHLINQTDFKENFFNYLNDLPPEEVMQYAREYWSIEYPQYFNEQLLQRVDQLREEGVQIFCISGGLDVYMDALFEQFKKVDHYYCTKTRYTGHTYKIMGEACKGEEKIKKLEDHFQAEPYRIVEAYSDSKEAILDHAEKAFLVNSEGKLESYSSKKNLAKA